MMKAGGQWLLLLAWGVLAISLVNAGIGFWALKRLERKAGTPIRGVFLPHLIRPVFTLREPRISWQNRFQVVSGNLEVRYEPLSVLTGRKLRVQVRGRDLKVRLLGDSMRVLGTLKWTGYLQGQGLSEVYVESIAADLALPTEGPPEIFLFNLDSPELQFNLAEK